MWEMLIKIFKNEIMYYIIVPLMIVFLNWIKNGYDIKETNKKLGYWKMKYKRLDTFVDITMKMYKRMAINLVVMQLIRLFFSVYYNELHVYVISALIFLIINILLIFFVYKEPKTKVEFLTDGKKKKILVLVLYLIFGGTFFLSLVGKYEQIIGAVLGALLIFWVCLLFKYSDVIFILDNSYADIYINGNEKAEFAEVGTIRKLGEWILVERYVNGYEEQIRIREKDITRIDYYGSPYIVVKKGKLFKKN